MTQSESPKSSSSSPSSVLNVEGKRVLEDVGSSDPSKLPKTSSSQDVGGRVPDITLSGLSKTFEKVEGKHVAGEDLAFFFLLSPFNFFRDRSILPDVFLTLTNFCRIPKFQYAYLVLSDST
jgi:hypothetical protein